MSEAFLSATWYRVAHLKPRLRDHAQVHRHLYRGDVWYVVQDHLSSRSHRLSPAAYFIVAHMDGKRTVNDLWLEAAGRFAADAPTQDQLSALLTQLYSSDLLQTDVSPDSGDAFERHEKDKRSKLWQAVFNPMSIRIPLINPDRFLNRTLPLVSPLFSLAGGILWLALIGSSLVLAGMHAHELAGSFTDQVWSLSNLALIALIYPFAKTIHEFGHAYAAKAFGAPVREMGVMFLLFYPVPYVDASESTGLRSPWQRAIIGAGGMLFETVLAACALYGWLATEPGLVRTLLFNLILVAGVSTVIFNGNPLLRYDGYFILCDLIGLPNLAQRATNCWTALISRKVFGMRVPQKTPESLGTRVWLMVYAPAAFVYRSIITLTIAFLVATKFFFPGVIMAIWSVGLMFVWPLVKGLKFVVSDPRLEAKRGRALKVTFGSVIALILFACLVPLPLWTVAQGVVWLPDEAAVRAGTSGFSSTLLAGHGAKVDKGTPLIAAEEPILDAEIAALQAQADGFDIKYSAERFSERAKAELTRLERDQVRLQLERQQERRNKLVVKSPSSGIFVVAKAEDLQGRYTREGETLGYVLPDTAVNVRVAVMQDDVDLVRHGLQSVDLRPADRTHASFKASILREVPAGQFELPAKALGTQGGGLIPVDPRDTHGLKTLARTFQFDLKWPEGASAAFGSHVHVRFNHAPEPLAFQVWRRVRQLFLSRFDV